MFEVEMSDKLKRIFDLKKVTFDAPGDAQEQECIFIEVERARFGFKDTRATAKVTGRIRIFANSDKLPFGYLHTKLIESDPSDTKDFFFYEIEENAQTYRNIVQRSASFIYFFDSQYDPSKGTITSIDLETTDA